MNFTIASLFNILNLTKLYVWKCIFEARSKKFLTNIFYQLITLRENNWSSLTFFSFLLFFVLNVFLCYLSSSVLCNFTASLPQHLHQWELQCSIKNIYILHHSGLQRAVRVAIAPQQVVGMLCLPHGNRNSPSSVWTETSTPCTARRRRESYPARWCPWGNTSLRTRWGKKHLKD